MADPKRNPDSTVRLLDLSDEAYAQLVAIFGGGGGGGGGTVDVSDRAGRLLGIISGEVSLSAATLADLNDISAAITNWPADFPDSAVLAKLEAIRALLAGGITATVSGEVEVKNDAGSPLAISGTVALDATSLAALEVIGLDAATLAALETIQVGNFPGDFPAATTVAKLEAIRLLLAATLTVQGTVALDGPTLAALETINAIVSGAVGVTNFPADYPDAAVLAKVEAVRALLAAPLAVTGPLTDAQLRANAVPVLAKNLLVGVAYDEVDLTYTGALLTVATFKLAAATVATLTLTYTGTRLDKVVRT